MYQLIGHTHS